MSGNHQHLPAMMDELDLPDNGRITIEEPGTFRQNFQQPENGLNGSRSPGEMSDDSQDSCHMEDATTKGYMDVNVKLAFNRSNSLTSAKIPSYKMTSNPRGLALIVDIEKYDNEIEDERVGSEVGILEAVSFHI